MMRIKDIIIIFLVSMLIVAYFLTSDATNVEYRRFVRYSLSGTTYTAGTQETPGWYSAINRTGVGALIVTYSAFPASPWCGCNSESVGTTCQVVSATTTTATVRIWAPSILLGIANAADSAFGLICVQGAN